MSPLSDREARELMRHALMEVTEALRVSMRENALLKAELELANLKLQRRRALPAYDIGTVSFLLRRQAE
jgi:hypothetical protein